ncbi:DUF885 family protein [bacterium]|nr:DUF885 family protein [bacterium]
MKRIPMSVIPAAALLATLLACRSDAPPQAKGYDDLLRLFTEWRAFARPEVVEHVPDYTAAAMMRQQEGIPVFQNRLTRIDTAGWSIRERVDWEIVQAEIAGLRFEHEVLRSWAKNPLFYAVIQMDEPDVPARELPEIYGVLNVFEHTFPLDDQSAGLFLEKLQAVPAILDQARLNLTEMTALFGMFGEVQKQQESRQLLDLAERLQETRPDVAAAARSAAEAADSFGRWLGEERVGKPEFSGIGVEHFDRYMREVHLVPYSWREQEDLLERELERSLSSLAMEEHRNRHLPQLTPASSLEEMQALMKRSVSEFMNFLKQEEIFTLPDYMHLEVPINSFIPEDELDFFYHIYYRDPLPLLCHQVHWLEKQRESRNTHPIRGGALLSKIWDSRAEGLATNFEELMMHAGILDDHPRGRELNWILLAFRAARGLAGLRLHAGEYTLDEAIAFASRYTPRNFATPESRMLMGDLALYLSQPGYGTSYVYGKAQLDKLIAEKRIRDGDGFVLKKFFDDYFSRGVIPASLIYWEMTGDYSEIREMKN